MITTAPVLTSHDIEHVGIDETLGAAADRLHCSLAYLVGFVAGHDGATHDHGLLRAYLDWPTRFDAHRYDDGYRAGAEARDEEPARWRPIAQLHTIPDTRLAMRPAHEVDRFSRALALCWRHHQLER